MTPEEERSHLVSEPAGNEGPGGIGTIDVVAVCPGNAPEILGRAWDVLEPVLAASPDQWPALDTWRARLPDWFLTACAPERTEEELEQYQRWWKSLSWEEKAQASREMRWSLANWLFWFESGDREWRWWDAKILEADTLRISVEVPGWPTALGTLQ